MEAWRNELSLVEFGVLRDSSANPLWRGCEACFQGLASPEALGHAPRNPLAEHGERVRIRRVFYRQERPFCTETWEGAPGQGRLVEVSVPGETLTIAYDELGRLARLTRIDTHAGSASRTTRYRYDEPQQITIDGPRSDLDDIWRVFLDESGNVVQLLNEVGHRTSTEFDAQGHRNAITDPNGVRRELSYDGQSRLIAIRSALGTERESTSTQQFDEAGRVMWTHREGEERIARQYDAEGRISVLTNDSGASVLFRYDHAGRLLGSEIRAPGNADARDRVGLLKDLGESASFADSGANQYDEIGRLTASFDDRGQLAYYYQYDDMDRVISVITSDGALASFEYNGFGELIAEHRQGSGTRRYGYDEAGNRIWEEWADGTEVRRDFDAAGRPVHIRYERAGEDTQEFEYRYDDCANGIGRMCEANTGGSTTLYDYDANGNAARVETQMDGRRDVTQFRFNARSQLTALMYPSGLHVEYHYSDDGRANRVTARQGGRSQVLASGIQYVPQRDGIAQLQFHQAPTGQTGAVMDEPLARSPFLLGRPKVAQGRGNARLVFDSAGRLVRDARGLRRLEYDAAGLLSEYHSAGEHRASYTYDALGRRVRTTIHQGMQPHRVHTLLYNQLAAGNVLSASGLDADGRLRVNRDYIWLGGRPVAQIENLQDPGGGNDLKQRIQYFPVDGLGVPGPEPGGNGTAGTIGLVSDLRTAPTVFDQYPTVQGVYFDSTSGLYHGGGRDYDPTLGRFLQPTPQGVGYAIEETAPLSAGQQPSTSSTFGRPRNYYFNGTCAGVPLTLLLDDWGEAWFLGCRSYRESDWGGNCYRIDSPPLLPPSIIVITFPPRDTTVYVEPVTGTRLVVLPNQALEHDFQVDESEICDAADPDDPTAAQWCTIENIACWGRYYHAPGKDVDRDRVSDATDYRCPIVNEQEVPLWTFGLTGHDSIKVAVGTAGGLPANAVGQITLGDHVFNNPNSGGFGTGANECPKPVSENGLGNDPPQHCNQVYRIPEQRGSKIFMNTRGTGEHGWDWINEIAGPGMFEGLDQVMRNAIKQDANRICPDLDATSPKPADCPN